jgi:hypothetical protein
MNPTLATVSCIVQEALAHTDQYTVGGRAEFSLAEQGVGPGIAAALAAGRELSPLTFSPAPS